MPVECKGVFSATKRMFNASCKIHIFLEWVILTFLWYLFFKVGNSTMIFPVIDCSFISLFMRLKAVMGNCNSLADHILVISKEFQLFHPFLYPPTPRVTAVQVHPSSFYPSTQVWMQTWWIRWVIQGFSSSIPMGLGCACQLQHCLYMSTPLPVNIPPPVIHRLILYLIINFFFPFLISFTALLPPFLHLASSQTNHLCYP